MASLYHCLYKLQFYVDSIVVLSSCAAKLKAASSLCRPPFWPVRLMHFPKDSVPSLFCVLPLFVVGMRKHIALDVWCQNLQPFPCPQNRLSANKKERHNRLCLDWVGMDLWRSADRRSSGGGWESPRTLDSRPIKGADTGAY